MASMAFDAEVTDFGVVQTDDRLAGYISCVLKDGQTGLLRADTARLLLLRDQLNGLLMPPAKPAPRRS